MNLPRPVRDLIESFEKLPGIGSKTAARLTFYLLHVPEGERQKLGQAVLELGQKTTLCGRCFNITSSDNPDVGGNPLPLCSICSDPSRDQSVICVVEEPLDLIAFEKTGKYRGLYHVLHGAIAPLEHIGPEDLKIEELMKRLSGQPSEAGLARGRQPAVREIILATNPSLEGEATAMYIRQLVRGRVFNGQIIKITRIARGIPTGGDLEYADEVTLTRALEGRHDY